MILGDAGEVFHCMYSSGILFDHY